MLTAQRTALVLLLAPLAAGQSAPDVPKGWQRFVSVQASYIAYYPGDWHPLNPQLPTLYIANFRSSEAVGAVVVPANGATISVAPAPTGSSSLDQWISRETAAHHVRSRGSVTLERAAPSHPLRVYEVVFESIEGPDTTSWYFDLGGHLLVGSLSYWKSDPNEGKYREILKAMMRALAPIPR